MPTSTANKGAKKAPKPPAKTTSTSAPTKLPAFDLESDQGKRVRSADLAGKWSVVYFYPRDSTPGCTREAIGFTAAAPALKKLGAQVYGVSKDSIASHCSFRDKYSLSIPLLSDPDLRTHRAFGALGKKVMYGKEVEGTIRSTFLVAPDGSIARAWRSVKVDGHVDAVLAALEQARKG
ncbi:MAG: peroxiredoxin [Polyangiaceae bacterium]